MARRYWTPLCLAVGLTLCAMWVHQISDAPIRSDAISNAYMAVNLAHAGVISDDTRSPPAPTMYREPVPAVTAAGGVLLADAVLGKADITAYLSGARAKFLKFHHILWKAAEVAAAYLLMLALTSSRVAALVAAILVGTHQPNVDDLMTELEAATLLLLGTALFLVGLRRCALRWMCAAGVCFGLLTLTKSAFLYIAVVFALATPLVMLVLRERLVRETFVALAVLGVVFAAVTLPWMARNALEFGTLHITERGGLALYFRALDDGMTGEEYKGTFYAWSPRSIRRMVGAVTGFSPRDLAAGGRLERLNRELPSDAAAERMGRPDEAVSYYRKARAERVRLSAAYQAARHPAPGLAADDELAHRSIAVLAAHPLKHMALTVPFLWRGAPLLLPVLLITLFYALRERQSGVALAATLAVLYVLFHAFFTDFEPRYADPVVPLATVLTLASLVAATNAWAGVRRVADPARP